MYGGGDGGAGVVVVILSVSVLVSSVLKEGWLVVGLTSRPREG